MGAVGYIHDVLFGRLPGQVEVALGVPHIAPQVRIVAIFDPSLPVTGANALIGLYRRDGIVARRAVLSAFAKSYLPTQPDLPDVIYAVTANTTHTRASAWPADDAAGTGAVPFTLNGAPGGFHCRYSTTPGTIALHVSARSLTALHEFQHAMGSYTNGQITDLYVDSAAAVNCKVRTPRPAHFGDYEGVSFNTDLARDSLGYPSSWKSYHCELHDPTRPSLMDDYWSTATPNACANDRITRSFLIDRIMAKLTR